MDAPRNRRASWSSSKSDEDTPEEESRPARRLPDSTERNRKYDAPPRSAQRTGAVDRRAWRRRGDETEKAIIDDREYNVKFLVDPRLVEEKILVELPPQRQQEKFMIPILPAEEKVAVFHQRMGPPQFRNGAPIYELQGDGYDDDDDDDDDEDEYGMERREKRHDSDHVSLSSGVRDLSIGMAHLTGGVLKTCGVLPHSIAKGIQKAVPAMCHDKPREIPKITGWKSGVNAAGTVWPLPTQRDQIISDQIIGLTSGHLGPILRYV